MKNVYRFLHLWIFLSLSSPSLWASHIFGGNLYLTQVDKASGKFKLTMNMYVDGNTLIPLELSNLQTQNRFQPLLVFFLPTTHAKASTKFDNTKLTFINKTLKTNKINSGFRSWRVAYARVVGGKNTNNGRLRLLPKWNTNNGTKEVTVILGMANSKAH